jgi:hypothetical protein
MIGLLGCSPRVTTLGGATASQLPALTVTGRICTQRPDPAGFPVKLVLVVDQSQANCIIDPPGIEEPAGFCYRYQGLGSATQPARVRSLLRLLTQLSIDPATEVALLPFETNPRATFPATGFARIDGSLSNAVQQLQVTLGAERDLQGALELAAERIASDIASTAAMQPAALPRARYLVVLITSGPARPTCAADDNQTLYADDLTPDRGKWPDSEGTACNQRSPITGFSPGGDRNQNAQVWAPVEQLKELQRRYNVGDVGVDAVLLTNPAALGGCGSDCQQLFGALRTRWPGPVPAPSQSDFIASEARYVVREIEAKGGGSFTEVSGPANLANLTLDPQRYRSLVSPNVVRELLVEPRSAVVANGRWVLDDDGDGVPTEDELAAATDPLLADTDGDGFSDRLELDRRAEGFDPLVRDARGCDPVRPPTQGCAPRDVDGDGLSHYAEGYLRTSDQLVDSDFDGFPDGLELKYGLDPAVALSPQADSDTDGVTDADELRRGTHPRQADATLTPTPSRGPTRRRPTSRSATTTSPRTCLQSRAGARRPPPASTSTSCGSARRRRRPSGTTACGARPASARGETARRPRPRSSPRACAPQSTAKPSSDLMS